MSQLTITLNGRSYRLSCGSGEEARLHELARHLEQRIDRLAMDTRQHGDERLLVMAALLATDELLETQAKLDALRPEASGPQKGDASTKRADEPNSRTNEDAALNAGEATAPTSQVGSSLEAGPATTTKPSSVARNTLEARLAEARAPRPVPEAGKL